MDKGIFATVEHRKLMELKNSGAVDVDLLIGAAYWSFVETRNLIKKNRHGSKPKGFFARFLSVGSIDQEVDIMFETRQDLVDHLNAVNVPTTLCPITEAEKEQFLFIDRAARYGEEARKILDMFKRHHEVIVDSDRSMVIEWVLNNAPRIREFLGVK